jgi:hypothetical protein
MDRQDIRDLSRKRLGETTASFWSDVELNNWINYACKDIAFRTKCLRDNDYLTSVESTKEYSLSTNFPTLLSIDEVYFKQDGDTWQKLEPTSRTRLDKEEPGWLSTDDGMPTKYYWDKEEDILGLHNTPDSDNAGTDYVRVYFTETHTDMTDDDDEPTIPSDLQLAIIDWVVATGLETRGHGDKANDAWQKYFSKLHDYQVERNRQREDDDIIMKNYRNL